jgi:3-deoxy-manno-octulosonate cytidylyltransferase (CMP-KDO synthetase)
VEEVFDPHAVKVVMDHQGYALYFSRAPIPWDRQTFKDKRDILPSAPLWFRHIGIYAYTGGFLRRYVSWPSSPLERAEALEQLRILYQGEPLKVLVVDSAPPAGVDTPADLERVKDVIAKAPF